MARRISRRVSAQIIEPASRLNSAPSATPATGRAFVDYLTGTASGWPFDAIITAKLLYGAVVLAFRGISTVSGGMQCASPALRWTVVSHSLQIERAVKHINALRAGVIMFCFDHTGRDVGPPHPNFLTLNSLQIAGREDRPVFGRLLGALAMWTPTPTGAAQKARAMARIRALAFTASSVEHL